MMGTRIIQGGFLRRKFRINGHSFGKGNDVYIFNKVRAYLLLYADQALMSKNNKNKMERR